jgi:hydrogenase maturation protease
LTAADQPLVVGIGSALGDDAVGPEVVAHLTSVPGVDVVEHVAPASLVELIAGRGLVVIVDAVVSGAAPGTVQVLTPAELPLSGTFGAAGTHGVGLAEAVELAAVLGRLPERLVVVGVEVDAPPGEASAMSTAVGAAVPHAVSAVLDVLGLHAS